MQKSLNEKVNQATKWSTITEICAKLVAPLTNAILARLLVPEAFGVVATLTMIVSFAEIFTDAGFQKYIVQHEFADENDLNTSTNVAFWSNLGMSFLIWGIIAVFATPISNMVGSPGCEPAVVVMGAQIPLLAFSSIQMARYRREFDFKSLFKARIVTAFVPLVITVPLAFCFRSYWALVVGTLARDFLNASILTVKSKWKPRVEFCFDKLKEMLSFSLWTIVENVSIWLTSYADTFIVSVALSAYYLGLYKTTVATVNAYMNLITAVLMPVLFSALSRSQTDHVAFEEVFCRFQRLIAMLVFPLGVGIFIYREFVTLILLGEQWLETADFLGMWSVTSALTIVFSHLNSEAFRSMGRPKLSVLTQVLHIVVLVPVLLMFVDKGYNSLTIARNIIRLELSAVSMFLLHNCIGIKIWKIFRNTWPQLFSSAVMALVGIQLQFMQSNWVGFTLSVCICCTTYFGCMVLLPSGRKQIKAVLNR